MRFSYGNDQTVVVFKGDSALGVLPITIFFFRNGIKIDVIYASLLDADKLSDEDFISRVREAIHVERTKRNSFTYTV